MKSRYFLALCMLCMALLIDASGTARAQPAPGNITAVTLLDVLSNANVPQNVETSSALLTKLASDTQQLPGLVSFKIMRESARSNHFIMLVSWKDMKSFEDYRAAATTRAFREAMQPRLGGPFDERLYIDLK